jgi:hypothetical protein
LESQKKINIFRRKAWLNLYRKERGYLKNVRDWVNIRIFWKVKKKLIFLSTKSMVISFEYIGGYSKTF